MLRRCALALLIIAAYLGLGQQVAGAHAGLQSSDPLAGAMLGASPTAVRLSFSEAPAPTLSSIRIDDASGRVFQSGRPALVAGDPLSLEVPVQVLPRGVYTVSWRAVSAVDGHATAGAYAFGVQVKPSVAVTAAAAAAATPAPTALEVFARWLLIVGLGLLLGVAVAGAVGFGEARGGGVLGLAAWSLAAVGLALLAVVQRNNAGATFSELLDTSVGRALVWRAVGLVVVSGALVFAARGRPPARRPAMVVAAVGALAVMVVHVAAGHAAGGSTKNWANIAMQWGHFAAVGIWLGGLAALLLAIRGAPSDAKKAAIGRFSAVALVGFFVVFATGVVRAFSELDSWGELVSTGYGRAIVAKTCLIVAIAVFAAFNRWRAVPEARGSRFARLRRTSSGELALAVLALGVAALLGSLTPPVSARAATPTSISVTGADFATTVRARLTTASPEPGPNTFTVRVFDYDSNKALRPRDVSLRFSPVDDPGVAPTTLALRPGPGGSFVGTGPNLAFDGRWRVTALIERGDESVTVPLTLSLPTPPQFVSVTRERGQPPFYAVQIADETDVLFAIDPERPGPTKITVTFADVISDERSIASVVLTTAAESGPVRVHPTQRISRGRFVANVRLAAGRTQVTATARTPDDARLRATFMLTVGREG